MNTLYSTKNNSYKKISMTDDDKIHQNNINEDNNYIDEDNEDMYNINLNKYLNSENFNDLYENDFKNKKELNNGEDKIITWMKYNYGNNLDDFFKYLYEYYYERGFSTFICSRITNIFTLFFIISISTFFFVWVEWGKIKNKCFDKKSCNQYSFIKKNPFYQSHSIINSIIITYISVFSIYWLYNIYIFIFHDLKRILKFKIFYNKHLKITQKELVIMSWDDVIGKFQELHKSGKKIQLTINPPSSHEIALRIMRYDNIFISLVNQGLFDLQIYCKNSIFGTHTYNIYLGKLLEWNIKNVLINDLFNKQFHLRRSWRNGSINNFLFWKIRVFAIISLFIMPFFLLFITCYFILNIAHEFHQKNTYGQLNTERWTPLAKWHIREYNELPHIFNKRINKSIYPSILYIKQFNNPCLVVFFRCLSFISGSIIGVILISIYLTNDNLLTIEIIPSIELNILQLLTISGLVLSISRSYIPSPIITEKSYNEDPNNLLNIISHNTHYMPQTWINRGHTYDVYNQFSSMFKKPIQCFIEDIISTIFIPYILWSLIATKCNKIVSIINYLVKPEEDQFNNIIENNNDKKLGEMCGPALFLLSSNYEEIYNNNDPTPEIGNLDFLKNSWNDKNNKLENSINNFRSNYKN